MRPNIVLICVFLCFPLILRASYVDSQSPTTNQQQSFFTFYLDSYNGTETNSSCLDELNSCMYMSQIVDSTRSILQRNNSSLQLLELTIFVRGQVSDCDILLDFSEFTSNFKLNMIGIEQKTKFQVKCYPFLHEDSKVDELTIVNGKSISLIFDLNFGLKNLTISKSIAGLTIRTNIENVNIMDSEINPFEITGTIQNMNLLNNYLASLDGYLKVKQLRMENSEVSLSVINIYNFDLVEIKNCKWTSYSGTTLFHAGEKLSIQSSKIAGPMVFEVLSVLEISQVSVNEVLFEPENGSFFAISTVEKVTIQNSNFSGNRMVNTISIQRCKDLVIDGCKHFDNLSSFLTILGSQRNHITIQNSEFYNNKANDALIIYDSNFVADSAIIRIFANNFINNIGGLTGSALKISKGNVKISESNFFSNKAVEGGAIYLKSHVITSIDYSNFTNNEASKLGGAIYMENVSQLRLWDVKETICTSNKALEAGGCIYIKGQPRTDVSYNLIGSNKANCYGNNIATDLINQFFEFRRKGFNLSYQAINNQSIIQVYPGELVDFRISLSDRYNQKSLLLPENQMSMKLNSNNLVLQRQDFTSGNDSILSNNIQILLNDYAASKEESTFSFQLKELIFSISMKIVDCPSGYSISKSNGIVKCEYIPIEIILPAAIVGTISSIIIFVTVCLAGIYIVKKLKKLRRQENAEKEMQKKFIDNNFIFNNGSTTSDLSIPLVEKSLSSEDSMQYTIPISEINILSKIGEGNNGTVYKAKWNRTDVAIKQLKTSEEENNEEFEREALLMSSLRHPSVVSCFGVSITNNSKYMIVEYMENGSLENSLYRSKIGREKLSFETKLNILIDVGKGMTYLHSIKPNKIIHRDLKPGNILLSKNLNAKVGDFGLSKIVSNNTATMTTNIGTMLYIAPELLSNYHKGQTTKLDVYSFGIIMWEVLFESAPFSNELSDSTTPFSILLQVTNGLRPSLSLLGENFEFIQNWIEENFSLKEIKKFGKKNIQKALIDYIEVMKLCWDKEPTNRPEFIEITESLESILEQIRK